MIVHCIHGKGRTGMAICAYLLYCGFAETIEDAIVYYRAKRYTSGGKQGTRLKPRGMKHTSQLRYLHYFEQILKGIVQIPRRYIVDQIELKNVPKITRKYNVNL